MKAIICALRIVPDKPARFVRVPGSTTDAPAFRVEVLGSVREIDWSTAPLAIQYPINPREKDNG